jgi:hypothetical protein
VTIEGVTDNVSDIVHVKTLSRIYALTLNEVANMQVGKGR